MQWDKFQTFHHSSVIYISHFPYRASIYQLSMITGFAPWRTKSQYITDASVHGDKLSSFCFPNFTDAKTNIGIQAPICDNSS